MNESIIHSVFQEIDNMRISYDEGYEIINNLSDDFAIGFAEWCSDYEPGYINKFTLEIYKKEKGL